jgi:hypothetical protein
METFGGVLARAVVEMITLMEGTLSHYVNITAVDGNITSVSLSSVGVAFCENLSNLLVSFAGALDAVMSAVVVSSH